MNIACLGWGSLIWKPDSLLINRYWFDDGPFLPVDFLRQSNDGRLTLVVDQAHGTICRTLWALMSTQDLNVAKESLRIREGISTENSGTFISSVLVDENVNDPIKLTIKEWAHSLKLNAVIWTNLPSKFNNRNNTAPDEQQAVDYLRALDINKRQTAEEYVRRTPQQIDTKYRRRFEAEFGWNFIA
jgi:hypothetical protein